MYRLLAITLLLCLPGCKNEPEVIHLEINLPEIVWNSEKPIVEGVHIGVHVGSACWCIPVKEWDTLIKLRPAAKDTWKTEYGPVYVLATKQSDGTLSKRLPWLKDAKDKPEKE